jgi:hypothetical protein
MTVDRVVGSFGTALILGSLLTPWLQNWLDPQPVSGMRPFDLRGDFWVQEGRVLPVCDGSDCRSGLKLGAVLLLLALLCGLGVVLGSHGRAVRFMGAAAVLAYTLVFVYEVRNRYILDVPGHDGLFHFVGLGVVLAIAGGVLVIASAFMRGRRTESSAATTVV